MHLLNNNRRKNIDNILLLIYKLMKYKEEEFKKKIRLRKKIKSHCDKN